MLYCPIGELLEANFSKGKIVDGKIKILFMNTEFYEGDFKGNKRNGRGVHYYKNGDFYDGEWSNDKRICKGKIIFADDS